MTSFGTKSRSQLPSFSSVRCVGLELVAVECRGQGMAERQGLPAFRRRQAEIEGLSVGRHDNAKASMERPGIEQSQTDDGLFGGGDLEGFVDEPDAMLSGQQVLQPEPGGLVPFGHPEDREPRPDHALGQGPIHPCQALAFLDEKAVERTLTTLVRLEQRDIDQHLGGDLLVQHLHLSPRGHLLDGPVQIRTSSSLRSVRGGYLPGSGDTEPEPRPVSWPPSHVVVPSVTRWQIRAQARWRKAAWLATLRSQRTSTRRQRLSQACVRSTTHLRARLPFRLSTSSRQPRI